jgi:voltage-dependent potassium channel beta subunit
MEYRHLGSSGLEISALSLGAWVTYGSQVDDATAQDCIVAAHDAGVNFFDNAETYASGGAEIVMGNVFKRMGWKRSELVVSTKVFWGGKGPNDRGLSRKHVVEGTNAALARLQLDYVDLLFCHRPDPSTPIEETVRAMNFMIDQGKAFYWGTSEWSAEQIMTAVGVARRERLIPPQMEQPQYNMLHRERVEKEYARLYGEVGLGTTIWSPLASGLLTGKYDTLEAPADSRANVRGMEWIRDRLVGQEAAAHIVKVKGLKVVADDLDCTRAQLAIAWCLKNPNVSSVITGASKPEQVEENMQALAVARKLKRPVMDRIEKILDNRPDPVPDYRHL